MAKIAKRRNRYVIDFYDNNGFRRWVTLPADSTKKAAREKLREIETQLDKGTYLPCKEVPSFKTVAADWLNYKKASIRKSTLTGYSTHVDIHFKEVENHRISHVTIAVVEKFISNHREHGMTLANLRQVLITFRQIMQYAVRHRYMDFNPVKEADKPKRDRGDEKSFSMHTLKPEQITALLDKILDPKHHMLILMAVMSGARQGELLGLKWSDVLWDRNQIHIQRSFNKGREYPVKTKKSNRKIDLGPAVMTELKKWRLTCPPNDLDLVFPNEQGNHLNPSNIANRCFKPALRAAELPQIRFHDLRHTYASLLIRQGENIKYIQKQLGHEKASTTLDIYAHLMEEDNPGAVTKLDAQVFGRRV